MCSFHFAVHTGREGVFKLSRIHGLNILWYKPVNVNAQSESSSKIKTIARLMDIMVGELEEGKRQQIAAPAERQSSKHV